MRHRNQADSLREKVVDTLPSRAERQEYERKEKLNDNWLKRPLGTAIEMLAAIPSIIYGMWGLFVFAPLFAEYVQPALINALGPSKMRLVTHLDVTRADCERAAQLLVALLGG